MRFELRNFVETIGDEEDQIDEHSVGESFDFKVTKERVGLEEVEGFINNVHIVRIG